MTELLRELVKWASRDRVCAMALLLSVIGVFPHAVDRLISLIQTIGPAVASAVSLVGGN